METNLSVTYLQRRLFKLYEEYAGYVISIEEASVFIQLDGGGVGSVLTKNVAAEKFIKGEKLRLRVIGFTLSGELELLPCKNWLQSKDAQRRPIEGTVELISHTAVVIRFIKTRRIGIFAHPEGLGLRWLMLHAGQTVTCEAYDTQEDELFVDEIASVIRFGTYIPSFSESAKTAGLRAKSLPEKNGLVLGKVYAVHKLSSKCFIDEQEVVLTNGKNFPLPELGILEAAVCYIPSSIFKKPRVTVLAILEG